MSSPGREGGQSWEGMLMRILSMLLLAALMATKVQAGEITGKVTLQAQTTKTPPGRRNVDDVYTSAELEVARKGGNGGTGVTQEVANVVVFLEGKGLPATPRGATMDQQSKIFRPHVLPIVSGSKVEFPNGDPIFHHVYSTAPSFEFPRYRKGNPQSKTFSIQGGKVPTVIELFCGIHSQMNAFVVVLPNRCFDTADETGTFSIPGVPPGTYTLKAWHPRTTPRLFTLGEITVGEGKLVKDIVLK